MNQIFGHKFKKTVSSDDMIFFIDEIIVNNVDFYCSFTLDTEAPTYLDRSTDNGKTLPDPLKYLSASQITININVLLMKSMHPIYFWTRTSKGALVTLKYITDWESMSHQYPQTTTHQLRTDL